MRTVFSAIFMLYPVANSDAGEISKSSFSGGYSWETTECYKPSAPVIFEIDDNARMLVEMYLDDVESFKDCVQREGQRDYLAETSELSDAIEEGIEEAFSDVNRDLQDLELSLMLVQ